MLGHVWKFLTQPGPLLAIQTIVAIQTIELRPLSSEWSAITMCQDMPKTPQLCHGNEQ